MSGGLRAEHDGVDGCDVAAGYVSVAINVAIDEVASVVVEQAVIERCNVGTGNKAIAVNVARNCSINGNINPAVANKLLRYPALVACGLHLSVGEIYVVFHVRTRGIAWIDIS